MHGSKMETLTQIADEDAAGMRLDKWLTLWSELSRGRVQALIADGAVKNGGIVENSASKKVKVGALYQIDIPAPALAEPQAQNIPLDIIYEDSDLIIINKPAGLIVHPGAGCSDGTLVNALLHHCAGSLSGIGGVLRPGIVHRIDKDTSGLMVAAKNDKAHIGLSEQFAQHTIERAYICFTQGSPKDLKGRIETRIARAPNNRKKMAVVKERPAHELAFSRGKDRPLPGKIAITNYQVMNKFGHRRGAALGTALASEIECRLETGRTHQIRVHMAHIGAALLGDPAYGKPSAYKNAKGDGEQALHRLLLDFRRQALHAAVLGFTHPISKTDIRFEAALPADLAALRAGLAELPGAK